MNRSPDQTRRGPDDDRPDPSAELLATLRSVRQAATDLQQQRRSELDLLPPSRRPSGENLIHYLAMRRFDLRTAQRQLARLGLSSLGRAEAHVMASLDAVIGRLAADLGEHDGTGREETTQHGPTWDEGDALLDAHSDDALGPRPTAHATRVMVTMPSAAATDAELVDELVAEGMSIARINGAHDGPEEWRAMADLVGGAARRHGTTVRVAFDLPGPKLRIGPLDPGPDVVRIRPTRDDFGRVTAPGVARFAARAEHTAPTEQTAVEPGTTLPIDAATATAARPGDSLHLRDARDRRRTLEIVDATDGELVATTERSTYLRSGLEVELRRDGALVASGRIGDLPHTPLAIELRAGDRLQLRFDGTGGRPALIEAGVIVEPASVSVELPEALTALRPGHRVLLDDGAIEGVVATVDDRGAVVEIVHPPVAKLRAEKGVNLPDTPLDVAAFTGDDRAALELMADRIDLVALSFIDDPEDVGRVHEALDGMGATRVGVVLKIERRSAFEALPELLLRSMRRPPVAVMVARGDLAVEIGFERLAEVQEEILWLCEAAHVPVIWATQVLESLAKRGAPTRAEITDAAWSGRAECVMLNKGPHIADAMSLLDGILTRMERHRDKRTPLMGPLSVASSGADAP